MSEEREAAFLQWLADGNSTGGCNPSMRKAWLAALEWQAARQSADEYVTLAYSQQLGGLVGRQGISREIAESAFYSGAPIVEVYSGTRRVFASLADFEKWRSEIEREG